MCQEFYLQLFTSNQLATPIITKGLYQPPSHLTILQYTGHILLYRVSDPKVYQLQNLSHKQEISRFQIRVYYTCNIMNSVHLY